MDDQLAYTPATELAAAIAAKRVSALEVTQSLLARIDRVNPMINAYCTVTADFALAAARSADERLMRGEAPGPLHGVPISIKDLTPTAGIRTTFGSKAFEHYVPEEDAIVVERVRRAGAIILGKNTPELGAKSVTDNAIFGHTRNPWKLDRIPGGSSGGAGAALAAGLGPLAEGSVAGLRVAWSPDLGYVPVEPEVRGITTAAAHAFTELGCAVEEAYPGFDADPVSGALSNRIDAPPEIDGPADRPG